MTIKPNCQTKTVDLFVEKSKKNSIQFQNSSYFMEVNGQILEDMNIFRDRYYPQLMAYSSEYTISDEQFYQVKYKPKYLSAILYGTVDYWYILLVINKMFSIMDFNRKKIKILTSDGVNYVKNVLMKEESEISENKDEVMKDVNEYESLKK